MHCWRTPAFSGASLSKKKNKADKKVELRLNKKAKLFCSSYVVKSPSMLQVQWFPFTPISTFIDLILKFRIAALWTLSNVVWPMPIPCSTLLLGLTLLEANPRRYFQQKPRSHSDCINTAAHIFTPFPRKKYFFSLISARKPQRRRRSVPDCCKRLIRLIRFFSDCACC